MIVSLLFLHPQSMHTQTASSYGVTDARQSKAKKNKKTINVACLERGKSKQNWVPDELPSLLLQK